MLTVAIYIQDIYTSEYNRVDLFDDEKISVVSSIQNINDISKTFTDFSQTFTVPASKQNNKIFRHWYDNSNDSPFSTLVKSDAYIEIDTITFRKGKIQLESANVEDGQSKDYSITFIGLLGNLKDTFAGLFLKDLTSSTYNIPYSPNEVLSRVVDNVASRDVMFPLISSKRNWNVNPTTFNADAVNWQSAPIRYNELFPALRLIAVFNMIQQRFGINFSGSFLTDNRFLNAYLYLKNSNTFLIKETITKINFTSESGYTPSSNIGYTMDFALDRVTNTTAILSAQKISKSLTFYITPSSFGINYKFIINKNGNAFYTSPIYISNPAQTINYNIETINGSGGATNDYFEIYVASDTPLTFTSRLNARLAFYSPPPQVFFVQVDYISASATTATSTLQTYEYMPEIKIEDFFSGILKMFNLTCFSNDGINYTLNTIDNYYDDGSDVDITKYVIQDKKTLNRVKTHKKINFNYEKSESFVNVAFNSNAGIEYGSLHYSNIPPAEGEEYSIKLPFENLNFQNLLTNSLFQVGYTLKTDLSSYIPKPIILYDYNSATTTPAGFTFYTSGALIGDGNPRTAYKAFGQETLIGTETYSLNFNEQQSTLTNEIVNNGLYQTYYSNYFANIFNFKARLVKVSAILPTSVLTTLKLNDNIIIRDAKYLINTMTTDLTTGLVQFELLTDQRL